ncbi:Zn-ribbon domain-containing OB-fold protein [Williamsia sp. DF01-3]|uniref:Zn-ribbon domain-containing OB-fold protein n=1 Tax=Williamsia sp. DF01-3 TaxID=2934157 RepID=UPI001FF581CB|nr:OB-fold domain-containing protein [Williamsia sp. DF01-3]MCK0517341.1 OB-fold domain-containing protein [Williamsia sp. DF01-3]
MIADQSHPAGGEPPSSNRALPDPSPWAEQYWRSGEQGILQVQRCRACDQWSFPPSPRCRSCWSADLGYDEVAGTGKLLTWTRNDQPWQEDPKPPYWVALIVLDEGIRILMNIINADEAALTRGTRLAVVFQNIGEGVWLPQARLVGAFS